MDTEQGTHLVARPFYIGALHDNANLFSEDASYDELIELVRPNIGFEDSDKGLEYRFLDIFAHESKAIVFGTIGRRELLAAVPTDEGSVVQDSSEEYQLHNRFTFGLNLETHIAVVDTALSNDAEGCFRILTDLLSAAAYSANREFPYITRPEFEGHKLIDLDSIDRLEYFKVHVYFKNDWFQDLLKKYPHLIHMLVDSGSYWISLIFRSKTRIEKNFGLIREAADFVNENPRYGHIDYSFSSFDEARRKKRRLSESTATEPAKISAKVAFAKDGSAYEDFTELIRVLEELEPAK